MRNFFTKLLLLNLVLFSVIFIPDTFSQSRNNSRSQTYNRGKSNNKKKPTSKKPTKKPTSKKSSSTNKKDAKKKSSNQRKPSSARKPSSQTKKPNSSAAPKYSERPIDLYQLHHVAMWGGVGYSALLNEYDNDHLNKFIGGAGGLLGVGYEWHYKKFMLAIGPEFRLLSSTDKVDFKEPFTVVWQDVQSPEQPSLGDIKAYDFSHFKEKQIIGQLMLPVMAGMQWEKWYFLAGVKFGYTLFDKYKQKSDLLTSFVPEMVYEPISYVKDLGESKYSARGKTKLGADIALSAEVGLNINPFLSPEWNAKNEENRFSWRFRVALFVDYGLPIINLNHDKEMVSVDVNRPYTRSLHTSSYATSKVNTLLVGAKFTALLQLNKPKQLPPQNPYIVLQILDGRTRVPFPKSETKPLVTIHNTENNKTVSRSPNINGIVVHRTLPGSYQVEVVKEGYLPVAPIDFALVEGVNSNLKEKIDTTVVYLYPEPVFSFSVVDNKNQKPISAQFEILDENGQSVIKDKSGNTQQPTMLKLPTGHSYTIQLEAGGYLPQTFPVGKQDVEDINQTFALSPIEQGVTFILRNLYFATAKTNILPQSEPELLKLFEILDNNKDIRILITGHTDNIGSERDNQILSEGRAKSVKKSMVERGIDPNRIETKGMGELQPIDTNDTEEGRQNNRRVEITIL